MQSGGTPTANGEITGTTLQTHDRGLRIIQVEEKVPLSQGIPLSLQHLFAMFGVVAAAGIRMILEKRVGCTKPANLINGKILTNFLGMALVDGNTMALIYK
jgi:xanthine/uracil permease